LGYTNNEESDGLHQLIPGSQPPESSTSPKPESEKWSYEGIRTYLEMDQNKADSYLETSKKGRTKLSEKGKNLSLLVWADILTITGKENWHQVDYIKTATDTVFENLKEPNDNEQKELLLKNLSLVPTEKLESCESLSSIQSWKITRKTHGMSSAPN